MILQHFYTFVVDRLILIRKRSDSAQDVEDVEASEILNSMEDLEDTEDMEDTETGLRTWVLLVYSGGFQLIILWMAARYIFDDCTMKNNWNDYYFMLKLSF